MNNIKLVIDFVHAALPWVLIGLLLTVFFARSIIRKKKEDKCYDYAQEGMCLGIAIGLLFDGSTGIGIIIGMLFGLVIGSFIKKDSEKHNE